jgi:hypothetical protein
VGGEGGHGAPSLNATMSGEDFVEQLAHGSSTEPE